jgi:hypothetical protein
MGTASNLKKHEPIAHVSREYPTEWTWYADDHPEKKMAEQTPPENFRRIEAESLIVRNNSH